MKKLRLNSSIDPKIQQRIDDARKKRKLVDDKFAELRENLDWLLVEMEDFEFGELDDSYKGYIDDCISIFNRAMRDVADASDTLRDNINNLD